MAFDSVSCELPRRSRHCWKPNDPVDGHTKLFDGIRRLPHGCQTATVCRDEYNLGLVILAVEVVDDGL